MVKNAAINGRGPVTYAEYKQVADFLHSEGDTRTLGEIMDAINQSRLDSIAGELVAAAVQERGR